MSIVTVRPGVRRRASYAHVAAGFALFLTLASGALAAHRYVISSTKQIKPGVLAALRARGGPAGSAGRLGAPGPQGPVGDRGPAGPSSSAPSVLVPGETETGTWGGGYEITEGSTRYRVTASFPIPLASPLPSSAVGYVPRETPPTAECPGVGRAAPGFLCLYEARSERVRTPTAGDVFDPEEFEGPAHATGRSGFAVELTASESEDPSSITGTFAVTGARSARPIAAEVAAPPGALR